MEQSGSKSDADAHQDRAAQSFPNLYRLLQLQPLESDRGEIEAALKKLLNKAVPGPAISPQAARRAKQLLELGKNNLLNTRRKAAYDAKWKEIYGSTVAREQQDWDSSRLDPYLPSGDPNASFNLSDYMENGFADPGINIEADFHSLLAMISDTPAANPTPSEPLAAVPAGVMRPLPPEPKTLVAEPVRATPAVGNAEATHVPANRQPSIARKIRKQRKKSMLPRVAGLLVSLICVMGILVAVNRRPPSAPNASPSAITTAIGNNVSRHPQPAVEQPSGSGLPRVSGLDEASRIALSQLPRADATKTNVDENATEIDGSADPSSLEPISLGASPQVTETKQGTESNQVTESNQFTLTNRMSTAQGENPDERVPSPEEREAWSTRMNEWRRRLADGSFTKAKEKESEIENMATTIQQRLQFQRMRTVAELAEQFHEALREAVAGMLGGESFTVSGPTQIGFVEGDENRVVLKISGRNKAFSLTELPLGIAYGLAELRLDRLHPTSFAKKAAFGWLHMPTNNRVVVEEVRKWMASAEADGAVPAGTTEVFDDNYAL